MEADLPSDRDEVEGGSDPPSLDFVTIFTASMAEIAVLEVALGERGFHVFVANRNIKTILPFATGIDPLGVSLQVPRSQARAALGALRELVGDRALPRVVTPQEQEAAFEAVTELGRRVRWAALCPPIAPVGVISGLSYFFRSLYLPEKPAGHGVTLAAFWLCWVWTAAILLFALWVISDGMIFR